MNPYTIVVLVIGFGVGIAQAHAQSADPYATPYPYQGASGTQYQYDLSYPADQLRYSVDSAAQFGDSVNVDPGSK
jgi:hypothetical protein